MEYQLPNTSHRNDIESQGFTRFSNVYSADEMKLLRRQADEIFSEQFKTDVDGQDDDPLYGWTRNGIFNRVKDMQWILFHPKLIAALKEVAGEGFYMVPPVFLKGFFARWHRDSDSPMKAGHDFFMPRTARPLQVAIYLQDDAGLDVIPKSHHELPLRMDMEAKDGQGAGGAFFKRIQGSAQFRLAKKRYEKLIDNSEVEHTIAFNAGDILSFDFGLRHRATPVSEEMAKNKIGIFFAVTPDTEGGRAYMEYLRTEKNIDVFSKFASDPELQEKAKAMGFNLA